MWKNNRRYYARRAEASAQIDDHSPQRDERERRGVSRREVLGYAAVGAAGAAAATIGARDATAAPSYLRGLGDFRRLAFSNGRTGERVNLVYYADGEYIREAIDEMSYFMRDWRRNEVMPIDLRTLDVAAAMHKRLETAEPFQLISAYRSPETNAMLRRKGRGVARNSYHTRGMAIDISMQSRSVSQVYRCAMSLKGGGVGRYTRAHFVHVDCGPPRTWGR